MTAKCTSNRCGSWARSSGRPPAHPMPSDSSACSTKSSIRSRSWTSKSRQSTRTVIRTAPPPTAGCCPTSTIKCWRRSWRAASRLTTGPRGFLPMLRHIRCTRVSTCTRSTSGSCEYCRNGFPKRSRGWNSGKSSRTSGTCMWTGTSCSRSVASSSRWLCRRLRRQRRVAKAA